MSQSQEPEIIEVFSTRKVKPKIEVVMDRYSPRSLYFHSEAAVHDYLVDEGIKCSKNKITVALNSNLRQQPSIERISDFEAIVHVNGRWFRIKRLRGMHADRFSNRTLEQELSDESI